MPRIIVDRTVTVADRGEQRTYPAGWSGDVTRKALSRMQALEAAHEIVEEAAVTPADAEIIDMQAEIDRLTGAVEQAAGRITGLSKDLEAMTARAEEAEARLAEADRLMEEASNRISTLEAGQAADPTNTATPD